jgi:predicted GNAT family acetyltransferase
MKNTLLVFDESSYFIIPSCDWDLQDADTTIVEQSDDFEYLAEKAGYLNDNLLKDVLESM